MANIKECERFQSFRKLAEDLFSKKPKLHGLPPKKRSLEIYLSKLNEGDDEWFRKPERAEVARELAELLEISLAELLPEPIQGERIWQFAEFRELLPLDLAQEDPCDIFQPRRRNSSAFAGWLPLESGLWHVAWDLYYHTHRWPQHAPLWITAPPGSGKHFLARWAEAKGWARCLFVNRLRDAVSAVPQPADRSSVIVVEEADSEADLGALATLVQLGRIVILAPFQFPHHEPGPTRKRAGSLDDDTNELGWTVKQWRLAKDWRHRFLDWIGQRMAQTDGLFNAEQMLAWLEKHDPQERILATPGDLLPLCELLNVLGPKKLNAQAPEQLSELLLKNLTERAMEQQEKQLWLTGSAAGLLQQLLAKRLRDLSAPLRGGSSQEGWATYYPEALLAPRISESELRAKLKKRDRLTKEKKRQAEDELIAQVTRPNPLESIALLKEASVLRTHHGGGLAVYPRWTQEVYLKQAAERAVKKNSPREWGRLVIEPERRRLIDEALDALTARELLSRVREALSSFDREELGSIGAVESLFAAVSRRLDRRDWVSLDAADSRLLHELWRQAESRRTDRGRYLKHLRLPLTRIDRYEDNADDFIASCWAYSFLVSRPEVLPAEDPPWLWPGWQPGSLASLEDFPFGQFSPTWAKDSGQSTTGTDRLFMMAKRFVTRCKDGALPKQLPSFLMVHAVEHAAEHGWSMETDARDWERWHSRILSEDAPQLGRQTRKKIADWLVNGLLKETRGQAAIAVYLQAVRERDPQRHQFTLENADWERVRVWLQQRDPWLIIISLAELSSPLQEHVIADLAHRQDAPLEQILETLTNDRNAPPPEIVERVLIALAESRTECGRRLPQLLYGVNRAKALQAAERAWRNEPESASTLQWFSCFPESIVHREPLLAMIRETPPTARPAWTRNFLLAMLYYTGEHTDEVFRLSQGIG